jgi:glycosyltransferase involved in cell wall biosynthesis
MDHLPAAGADSARQAEASTHSQRVAFIVSNSFDEDPRAQKIAQSLVQFGHDVSVFAWDREGSKPTLETRRGAVVRRVGPRSGAGGGLRQLPAMLVYWQRVVRFLLDGDFSVIHCNRFDTLVPALIARAIRRRPIVYDLHTSYADRLRIHDRQWMMPAVRRLVTALETIALRRWVFHAFSDSPEYSAALAERGVRSVSALMNLPTADFGGSEQTSDNAGTVTFGRIGAFSEQLGQGVDDLFFILDRVRREYPAVNVHLQLVGNFVPASYLERVRERMRGLTNDVTLVEYVPYESVSEWYRRLNIAVITYQVSEGARYSQLATSQKLFECMAHGIPVVLLANPLMERIVADVGCGIVPVARDHRGIYEGFLQLLLNPDQRRSMGANGKRAHRERYHWEIEASELNRVYKTI